MDKANGKGVFLYDIHYIHERKLKKENTLQKAFYLCRKILENAAGIKHRTYFP
jgi:hypothetical protein